MSFPGGSVVKNLSAKQEMQEIRIWSLGWEDPLEEEMQSSILAWRIPWTEEARWATVHGITKSWTRQRYTFYMSSIKHICVWTHTRLKSVQSLSYVWLFATPWTIACPSPTPRAYSNSCPLSRWCHPTISSSVIPFSFGLQSFPASGASNESVIYIRWPKYWSFSFSISPSNEYSGLI